MTTNEEQDEIETNKSLNLDWVFGMNKDIYDGVHHLGDDQRKEIFYVAGHIGVIYNFDNHTQKLLQGHTNAITSVCVSKDKKWIVTADSGVENMIVIWDSTKYIPVKTIFNPHVHGTQSIDISHNGMYIVSLSYPYVKNEETDEEVISNEQTCSIWQWTSKKSTPIYSSLVKGNDGKPQTIIRFHPKNYKLLVSNSVKRVIFWSWEENKLKFYSPPVSKSDFGKPVGEFTQSTFITGTTMAATATKNGEIVLWQQVQTDKATKLTDKKALKVVQVHKSAINFISTVEGKYIVTGGMDGFVRFFDYQLRLQAWFEEFDAGPITSISFQKSKMGFIEDDDLEPLDGDEEGDDLKKDDIPLTKFQSPNFIVATSLALILHVKSESFNNYELDSVRGVLLVQGQEGPIQSLAVHPNKPYLAISGLSGHLHLWDYEKKRVLSLTMFHDLLITCIAFDKQGSYLAVGCTNGVIKILDVKKFDERQSFQPSKSYIQKISFSHDSKYFAFSDLENCIGIFKWGHRDEDERKPIEWVYIGRCQSHKFGLNPEKKLRIADFQWGMTPHGSIPRLMSIGEDRRLVEYDLRESRITEGVKVKSVDKIGQNAHPTAFLWTRAQNITIKYQKEKSEYDCLLICNDHYKFLRYVTPDSGRNTYCTKTFRCPTYGGPITKMILINTDDEEKKGEPKLFAYSTDEQVVGLILLPLDGNPNKMMGLIAHSGEILDFACSNDGKYLFTAGGVDHTVNQWKINSSYLENQASKTKGNDLETFISLIEGGREGEFFGEIKQYFFYAQIRSQGEVTTNERKISGEVPVSEVKSILRALGFYATEYEIENLLNELRSILGYTSETSSDKDELVDFDTFIKVYVNHKPIYLIDKEDIENAFEKMGCDRISGSLGMDKLLDLLTSKGEVMKIKEVDQIIHQLLGKNVNWQNLAGAMQSDEFAKHVLCFDEDDL